MSAKYLEFSACKSLAVAYLRSWKDLSRRLSLCPRKAFQDHLSLLSGWMTCLTSSLLVPCYYKPIRNVVWFSWILNYLSGLILDSFFDIKFIIYLFNLMNLMFSFLNIRLFFSIYWIVFFQNKFIACWATLSSLSI